MRAYRKSRLVRGANGGPTYKTHYNPTFWTALWNREYYESPRGKKSRRQRIQVLNLKSQRIHPSCLEDVHCERGLGLADLPAASMISRALRDLPPGMEQRRTIAELESYGDAVMDHENFYTALDRSPAYQAAQRVAREHKIASLFEKANIAIFIATTRYRHPSFVAMAIEEAAARGLERWEGMLELRKLFEHPEWLLQWVLPLISAHWTLHVARDHLFPLPDLPALENDVKSRVWIALSPRVLLEISLDTPTAQLCTIREFDPSRDRCLYRNYQRLAIKHAYSQIIFHDPLVLRGWMDLPEFGMRVDELSGPSLWQGLPSRAS